MSNLYIKDVCNDIAHIGVICADIEQATKSMSEIYGLEPTTHYDNHYELIYRGEEAQADSIVRTFRCFDTTLEFIQPVGDGKSAWHEYLNIGQSGLHHIGFNVDDYELARKTLLDKGLEILIEGYSAITPGLKYSYFDSLASLGFVIEITNSVELENSKNS